MSSVRDCNVKFSNYVTATNYSNSLTISLGSVDRLARAEVIERTNVSYILKFADDTEVVGLGSGKRMNRQ